MEAIPPEAARLIPSTAMIDEVPMIIPSMVRIERVRLRQIAAKASAAYARRRLSNAGLRSGLSGSPRGARSGDRDTGQDPDVALGDDDVAGLHARHDDCLRKFAHYYPCRRLPDGDL